jgi:hypothetical protein
MYSTWHRVRVQRRAVHTSVGHLRDVGDGSLDPASMVLLEKLNKIEHLIGEQGRTLLKLEDTTNTCLSPLIAEKAKVLEKTNISPTQLDSKATGIVFQVPRGGYASLSYFMSLPFVRQFFPAGHRIPSLICDNHPIERSTDHKLVPNLHLTHLQTLVNHFLTEIHPLHPVIDIATVERYRKELNEDGLSWTGETGVIMYILAIGSVLAGEDSTEYYLAAKRRMGFAIEKVDVMAIQAHYLQA